MLDLVKSEAAKQRNFLRKCWRCGSTFLSRYKDRRVFNKGYYNGLCQNCIKLHKSFDAKRPLNAMEKQWLEVVRIHLNLGGPAWYGGTYVLLSRWHIKHWQW